MILAGLGEAYIWKLSDLQRKGIPQSIRIERQDLDVIWRIRIEEQISKMAIFCQLVLAYRRFVNTTSPTVRPDSRTWHIHNQVGIVLLHHSDTISRCVGYCCICIVSCLSVDCPAFALDVFGCLTSLLLRQREVWPDICIVRRRELEES